MFVCVCNAITESDIRKAASNGVDSLEALTSELNVGGCCGCCCETAAECLNNALSGVQAA
ncbi:MAG: (2Fe-2S)-binding protein [Gammaproteobacteria bacterium]|nr:(2Fe-2S)-binding protein [Gammaproteobacteria bacterium]